MVFYRTHVYEIQSEYNLGVANARCDGVFSVVETSRWVGSQVFSGNGNNFNVVGNVVGISAAAPKSVVNTISFGNSIASIPKFENIENLDVGKCFYKFLSCAKYFL